jgi:hypothetical protein
MSNNTSTGLQITPLVMAICSALWLVLFALVAWNLSTTVELAKSMNNLPQTVQDHEQRIRVLEAKK